MTRPAPPARPVRPGHGEDRGAKRAATPRNRSLASVSPIVTRTPSPSKGRTTTPASRQAAANSPVRDPRRNQTKLACEGGGVHPCARSSSDTRERSPTSASTRSISCGSAASDATAAAWAMVLTPNGTAVLRSASATGTAPTANPTRSPARP